MKWSPQQDEALIRVSRWLNDPLAEQVFRLFGWAGTGKSTLALHLAKDVNRVCFAAFTGKAAVVMQKNGCFDASTIHSLIYSWKETTNGEPSFVLSPVCAASIADLIVIDEVSMVDEALARDLLSFKKKILVLGDPFQLPPVKGAGYFINEKPDFMLTEIHRQAEDNPIIRMSMDVRNGKGVSKGSYGESKVISRSDVDKDEVLKADQILCGRNRTRITYNNRVRSILEFPGSFPIHGDKLVCLRNNSQKNLLNGQLWTVDKVKSKRGGAIEMVLDPEDIQSTRKGMKVVTHEKWFQGREDEFEWKMRRRYDEFYFGYALTVHKSQGSQWDHVFLFDESDCFRETAANHLYTAITRASERVTVVQ